MDLDEKNQVLKTNVWCKYKWMDHFLTWNERDFGGVKQIRIPIDYIWKPDFVLYNFAGERFQEQSEAMAVITSDGTVSWIPPAILKSTCEIDASVFPFDEQKCSMKFGSWTYNGNALDPFFYENQEFVALDDFMPSNEWTILEHWGQKNIRYYECCPNEPYPDLTFHLRFQRKATFYNYILILPSVLLSSIVLVMFLLPPESPAKISLGINIIAAFFLLLLLLKDATPTASQSIPLIGAYYCFNMIVTTISTFMCSIVVNLHFGADKRNPPPRWLKTLMIDVGALVLCVHVPTSKSKHSSTAPNEEQQLLSPLASSKRLAHAPYIDSGSPEGGSPASPTFFSPTAELDLRELRQLIKQQVQKAHAKELSNRGAAEWRIISRVLDRVFFVFYFVCMIISLGLFFLKPLVEIFKGPRYPNGTVIVEPELY